MELLKTNTTNVYEIYVDKNKTEKIYALYRPGPNVGTVYFFLETDNPTEVFQADRVRFVTESRLEKTVVVHVQYNYNHMVSSYERLMKQKDYKFIYEKEVLGLPLN